VEGEISASLAARFGALRMFAIGVDEVGKRVFVAGAMTLAGMLVGTTLLVTDAGKGIGKEACGAVCS
jgi:hypothetical protein